MRKLTVYLVSTLTVASVVGCSTVSHPSAPRNFASTDDPPLNQSSSVHTTAQNPVAYVSNKSAASSEPTALSSVGRSAPLAGVYHPYRLHVVSPLKTVSGTVEIVRHEPDHDHHINLKLDPQYATLIDTKNDQYEHGNIVVEVIPMDQHDVPIPVVGQHITVTGAYVKDADHGWMEIHPAWFINGHGSAHYTAVAAAASVQTGLSGNGDVQTRAQSSPATRTSSSASSAGLSLMSFTRDVMPGNYASITIHGVPGTTASIEVIYKSGPSHASGLLPETVDTTGNVSWQWKVGTRTTPGNWPVYIQDAGKALTETLRVH